MSGAWLRGLLPLIAGLVVTIAVLAADNENEAPAPISAPNGAFILTQQNPDHPLKSCDPNDARSGDCYVTVVHFRLEVAVVREVSLARAMELRVAAKRSHSPLCYVLC
ncbi:MAG: hypothetical protein ACJ8M1_13365 [Chthoniobacterales bacterium]